MDSTFSSGHLMKATPSIEGGADLPPHAAGLPVDPMALLHTVLANTHDGVIVTDADNKILMVNAAFTTVTGFTADEAVGRTPAILRSGRHGREFYQAIWESLLTTHQWQGEIWNRNKSGTIYVEHLRITRFVDPGTGAVRHIAVFTDVTEHRRARDRVERQSRFDALTGLPNRNFFVEQLTAALALASRKSTGVVLAVVNIDNFRRVNELYGHATGDQVLIAVARGLQAVMGENDVIARLSGDEYAIMAPSLPRHQMMLTAPDLQQAVAAAGDACGLAAPLTACVGIAASPEDGETADLLLGHAAAAVDEAQKSGANGISCFNSHASERLQQRIQLEAALRRAVKGGHFTLVFQPRVDMRRGTLVGTEALIRWTDPQLGPVPPATFIPLAEECGLIEDIGAWVLEEVAKAAAAWRAAAHAPIPFAANVSAVQLGRPNLVPALRQLLQRHGLEPSDLQIEVTETAVVSDSDMARQTLSDLREMGLTVALDDFGTGFATLASLRQLPADEIKIDRSFISGLHDEAEDAEIVRMVVALGGALKRAVVAEGVETRAQAEILLRLGCYYGQGWLFGRPMPLESLMSYAVERRADAP